MRFLALVLATTVIDYVCGLSISGKKPAGAKTFLLAFLPAAWSAACYFFMASAGVTPALIGVAALLGLIFGAAHELIWLGARENRARYILVLSVTFCLLILGFFKYFGFFVGSARSLLTAVGLKADWTTLKIILPVGISFYTFQSLGYVIDVYRGQTPACAEFGYLCHL